MLLGVLQARAHVMDTAANLATIDAAAQRAAASGAELLLTPELFTVGYAPRRLRHELDPASLAGLHETLGRIAARHSIALVYSLPAVHGSTWRITSTFVDETGVGRGTYVKVHLFGEEEKEVFTPGDQPATIIEYRSLRWGMLICFDVEFPESLRAAALRGAQVLLVPTALGSGYEKVGTTLVPARALENQVYIAYANHTGVQDGFALAGTSVIADPFGQVLALGGKDEQLLFARVDAQTVVGARAEVPYLVERRADLYHAWGL